MFGHGCVESFQDVNFNVLKTFHFYTCRRQTWFFFFLQGANSNLYCIGNYEIIIETFTGLEALNAD